MKLLIVFLCAVLATACSQVPLSDNQVPRTEHDLQSHEQPLASDNISAPVGSTEQKTAPKKDEKLQHLSHEVPIEKPVVEYKDLLWNRIRQNLQLEHPIEHASVQSSLNWYLANPYHLKMVSERAERYLFYFVEEVEKRNLPSEIALLPFVESSLDPYAHSHGGAAGLWQFISSTGEAYGLKQDWWVDDRRNIRLSTEAALQYLTDLHRQFDGDWLLALASYNSGAGTVRRAIKHNKKLGLATDYWSLKLPKETKSYVPKLIALAKLIEAPGEYQIQLKPIPEKPYFTQVNTLGQIELENIAKIADIELEEVYQLNPEFKRWATHPKGSHEILIPVEKSIHFTNAIAQIPESEKVAWNKDVECLEGHLTDITGPWETRHKPAHDLDA